MCVYVSELLLWRLFCWDDTMHKAWTTTTNYLLESLKVRTFTFSEATFANFCTDLYWLIAVCLTLYCIAAFDIFSVTLLVNAQLVYLPINRFHMSFLFLSFVLLSSSDTFTAIQFLLHFFFTRRAYARAVLGVCPMSIRPSVRLSVCLSVTRVDCDKSKWWTADILIPHKRAIILLLWHQQWLVGNAPFPPKFALKVTHPLRKTLTSTDFRS